MRIGFDGKRATHNFRGLGNYSRGIIDGLATYYKNFDYYLYSPEFNDPRAKNWILSHKNLTVKTPNSIISKMIPSLWRSFLLEDQIKRDNLDLYHGLSHEIPKISTHRKFKVAVTIHDLIYLRYPEYFPKVDRLVYDKKFRYASNNADLIIAICEQTKSDLINFFNIQESKIKVHYQSCSPLFYDLKSKEELIHFKKNHQLEKPYILNVGAFEPRKNQLSAVLAFSLIANKYDVELVLVGNGKQYLKEVRDLITKLNLNGKVKILNNVSYHSLPSLYQAAEMFLFPSHFEGFGIPIVEALFSKIPVLTSSGSCFPESAGPSSLYFNSNSVEEMAEQITKIFDDSNLKSKMVNQGYDFVQKFTLENTTNELVKIYKSILI